MNNKLCKEFYENDALLKAIQAYKSLADISFTEDDNYYYYNINKSDYEPDLVANEFENYILGIMNT
ncbi:hypothetical protein SAMN02910370_02714 [Lachnospiraceae bacterium XPB1003]|nr:hypothetical protein SAMN02910370_02714 [Lachnospiraceae bacterium XPB1003]